MIMDVQNKKIVLIVHNYYKIPGGEDTVVANEMKLLEDNGHKAYLYSRHNNELDHMSKLSISLKSIFNFTTYREIRKIIKEKSIDIVHVHNTFCIISPAVYYAAMSRRVPVVQTVHNFRLLCPNALFFRAGHICEECLERGLIRSIMHSCYHGSVFQTIAIVLNLKIHRMTGIYKKVNFICLTEFNKQKLLELRQIRPEKVFVKPNLSRHENILSSFAIKQQFVYIGRLDLYKGIEILFKAWKSYEERGGADKLIICGTGECEGWCCEYIKENQLKNIDMQGFVSNEKVIEIIAESKALIIPTQLYEGFPMTIVEAYSVGTPVIASDIGNAADLVKEGLTGKKFHYNSSEDLCDTIENFSMDTDNRVKIRELFNRRYKSNVNYNQLREIYERST